jgi:hypothetical protein
MKNKTNKTEKLKSIDSRLNQILSHLNILSEEIYEYNDEIEKKVDDILSNITEKSISSKEVNLNFTEHNIKIEIGRLKINLNYDKKVILNEYKHKYHLKVKTDLFKKYCPILKNIEKNYFEESVDDIIKILKDIESE